MPRIRKLLKNLVTVLYIRNGGIRCCYIKLVVIGSSKAASSYGIYAREFYFKNDLGAFLVESNDLRTTPSTRLSEDICRLA